MDYNKNKYIANCAYTKEEEVAALKALSYDLNESLEINAQFEDAFADYLNVEYVLSCCNGTAAMIEAMWACGVGTGTEIIAPAMTYWASVFPAYTLGAKVKYVDIDPQTLCIDEKSIVSKITSKTKAIVVVHLYGYPCNMEKIIEIAHNNNIKVIEDFSHAHGAKYKNRVCGTIGDIGIASCMREKPFGLPEGGILCTNSFDLYEKCCAFGHYRYLYNVDENKKNKVENERLLAFAGAPIGTIKNRMNPVSAAIGIKLLERFDACITETNKAVNYFIDLLEASNYYTGHRIKRKDSSMGGWYEPKVFLCNGDNRQLANMISKDGYKCYSGHKYACLANNLINSHSYFREPNKLFDVIDFKKRDCCKKYVGIEKTESKLISIPRFSIFDEEIIEEYAGLYIKAAERIL